MFPDSSNSGIFNRKIFLIDSNLTNIQTIAELLTSTGFSHVKTINNPHDAIAILSKEIDACIVFITCPIDGLTAKLILDTARKTNPHIKGFILSENPEIARQINSGYPVINNRNRPTHALVELLKVLIQEVQFDR